MAEELTEDLLQELLSASSPSDFIVAHDPKVRTLAEYLQQLLDKHGLERATVVREANLNPTFGYQIFTGARQASRNKVLQIAFAMQLDLQETNRLLQAAGVNGLYCKDRRDAIIIFCLAHSNGLQKTNEVLYDYGEDTIC